MRKECYVSGHELRFSPFFSLHMFRTKTASILINIKIS